MSRLAQRVPTDRRIDTWLKDTARALRQRMPPAEVALWQQLRGRQAAGLRFRRQMPLHGYLVDFCCPASRVVVEVDGDTHAQTVDADAQRDAVLADHGYVVLRFSNSEVKESLEGVVERIIGACQRGETPS